ncbi:MAG: Linearmycin resistance permease protein LnrN [Syntrophus sp. SKADARSKE-3]|nr:Linearmycin resistance permease protein LnrN [Syntrophus sp. SKADARSKE-3]
MKVLATIYKEGLLLTRDLGGLALIFLMPLVLVVVMALIQDNTFREIQETRLEILFVDEEQGALSAALEQTFQTSPNIRVIKTWGAEPLTEGIARQLVLSGKYRAAIIIPPNVGVALREKTKGFVTKLLTHYGLSDQKTAVKKEVPAGELRILYDPAIKANYRQVVTGAVEKMAARIQAEWLMEEVQAYLSEVTKKKKIPMGYSQMIAVREQTATAADRPAMAPNAVQHNVPAWAMFAMFFILFPLAGNFIKEREEGSMLRLRLISGSQLPVIAGKFVFYLFVCLLQLLLMIGAGLYVMPLVGLTKLVLGTNYAGVLLTGFSVAMAATGYGLLIAVYFKTPQQALSFGSISVVILAAVGGVWIPVFIMPEAMQQISSYSPLHWGLSAFNNLFLRNAPTSAILPDAAKLLCFSFITLAASVLISKSRTVT